MSLGIPQYPDVIKYPMDYGTIMTKLKRGEYETMEDWTVDMQLVLTNAKIFNPHDHPVHQWANTLQNIFDKKLAMLNAKPDLSAFKKAQRLRRGPPMSDEDWQRCRAVLRQVQQMPEAYPFLQPVDWKALGIPDYPKIIKNPMDIGTVERYLMSYLYSSSDEFATDMRLVFKNAKRYNLEGSDIHKMAGNLETVFEAKWADVVKTKGTKRVGEQNNNDDATMQGPQTSNLLEQPIRHLSSRTNDTSEISDEERRLLGNKINMLTGEQLGQLVDLVRDECPKSYEQFTEEECEIDIDSLDRSNFDRLMQFVETSNT